MLNFLKVSGRNLSKNTAKILAMSLAISVVLCACGSKEEVSTPEVSTETVSAETSETSVSAEETVKEEVAEAVTEEQPQETKEEEKIININTSKRPVPENEAQAFVRDMGAGWNLGNTFDANDNAKGKDDLSYETIWQSNVTSKQNVLDLKEAGFKTIRVPVSWHNHIDDDFNINDVWMQRVKEVVGWILEEDMYVILNIHHDNEKSFMYPSYEYIDNSKKYVSTIWSQIAKEFGDFDEHLIFECLNEPRLKDTPNEWWVDANSDIGKETIDCVNQLNQTIVDTIRSTEGKYNTSRYIMCPGYCAAPEFALNNAYKLPDDSKATAENRLLVSIHAYTPYTFALAEPKDATDKFHYAQYNDTKDINDFMMQLYNKFIKEDGIGVVIGEFGSRKRGDNVDARTMHAAYYVATARSYGMSCCWWDNNNDSGQGEEFMIYKRRQNTMKYPSIVAQLVYYGNN